MENGVEFQLGQLTESVSNLSKDVVELTTKVDDMTALLNGGKGMLLGLAIAAGAVGSSVWEWIKHFFRN